jgi:hypothetical protein
MISAAAKVLRRHHVSFSIVHLSFVIAGTALRAATTNDKM